MIGLLLALMLHTATPSPTACSTAAPILTLDAQLDAQSAATDLFGQRTYYLGLSRTWRADAVAIGAWCARRVPMPARVCASVVTMRTERAVHLAWVRAGRAGRAMMGLPASEVRNLIGFNAQWAVIYTRLIGLWAVACLR